MPKITVYSGSTITMANGEVLHGSTTAIKQVTPEDLQPMLDYIQQRYPLPDFEIITLPFIIMGSAYEEYYAVTDYDGKRIYISAIDAAPMPLTLETHWAMWAHEIGHVIELHHMPFCPRGIAPTAELWQTFQQIHGTNLNNLDYDHCVGELFAEAFRYHFYAPGHSVPNRMLQRAGIDNCVKYEMWAWMRSLPGNLVLRENDPYMYQSGKIIPAVTMPRIIDDRLLIPIRTVGEQLGHQVVWDYENNAAVISR